MLLRDRLDRALEQDCIVAGRQRVGAMCEVDLELAGGVLGDRSVGRNTLRLAGLCHRVDELALLVQVLHRIDLRTVVAPPTVRLRRWLRASVRVCAWIEQVELQFHRDHCSQPKRL